MNSEKLEQLKLAIENCNAPDKLCSLIQQLRKKKKAAEQYINTLKELDELIKSKLLMYLDANAMKTAHFEGLGIVTKTARQRAEIKDFTKLAEFVSSYMARAQETDTPVSDALSLFQKRLATRNILDLIEMGFSPADMGIEIVDVYDVTIKTSNRSNT